jgi:SNF2 family DNA or RNA helicase
MPSTTVLFLYPDVFFIATMDQAVARIHRMNQLKETFIHTIVIKDTIEESLMDTILDKKVTLSNL